MALIRYGMFYPRENAERKTEINYWFNARIRCSDSFSSPRLSSLSQGTMKMELWWIQNGKCVRKTAKTSYPKRSKPRLKLKDRFAIYYRNSQTKFSIISDAEDIFWSKKTKLFGVNFATNSTFCLLDFHTTQGAQCL